MLHEIWHIVAIFISFFGLNLKNSIGGYASGKKIEYATSLCQKRPIIKKKKAL